jgi:hypothetical protein
VDIRDPEIANGQVEEDGEGKSGMGEATRYDGHSTLLTSSTLKMEAADCSPANPRRL